MCVHVCVCTCVCARVCVCERGGVEQMIREGRMKGTAK